MGKSCWNRPCRIPNRSKCRNKHMAAEWLHFFSGPFCPFFFCSFFALSKHVFYTIGSMTAGGYSFSRPNGKTKSKQAPKRQKFTVEGQVWDDEKNCSFENLRRHQLFGQCHTRLWFQIARQSIVNFNAITELDFRGKSHWFGGHFWLTPPEVIR